MVGAADSPPVAVGKHVETSVYTPGFWIGVCRRRRDGFTRIELQDFGNRTRTSFYVNDEERRKLSAAFALPGEAQP